MIKYLIQKIFIILLVLWMAATLTYFMMHLTPGDTANTILISVYGEDAVSKENLERVKKKLDLDRPLFEQYSEWMGKVCQGDFGISYQYQKSVLLLLKARLPNTISLTVVASLLSILFSVPLGMISARNHNRFPDQIGRVITLLCSSFPSFWIAMILILFFSIHLKWVPAGGMEEWKSMILPSVTLSIGMTATLTRMMRSGLLDVMNQDYVLVARGKGLYDNRIFLKHIFKNTLPSMVTVIGLQIGHLLGGAVVVENLFSWPGIGALMMNAIYAKDLPMIEGCVLVITFGYVFIHFIVDLIYAFLDPRVRLLKK